VKTNGRESFQRIGEEFWELAERMEETLIEEFSDEATRLIARYKQLRDRTKAQDKDLARHMDMILWIWTDAKDLHSGELAECEKVAL
jgi:hypothetical protein